MGRLLDTDVFVDHLRGARRLRIRPGDAYSTITRCELMAGQPDQHEAVRQILDSLADHPVDCAVADRAGELRRATGVPIADALVAATALEHRLTLVTRNRRDFERIPGLTIDPPD